MDEYDVDDARALGHSWRAHDWTADEVQFSAQLLQHGNAARAWASIYQNSDGKRFDLITCTMRGEEMAALPHIADYVAYVRAKMRERMEVTQERILEEVANLAYSNMADFIVIQEDGTFYTDFSGLTREQLAAIQEVTVDTYMDGRGEDAQRVKSVKFKLAPKAAAVELLGKHKKLWTDVVETNDLAELSDEITRRRRESRERREEAAQRAEATEGEDNAED